ncbi:unnamed protein product [Leptidea sinapis]|uniref:MADF domain-containing protein n=1 Tax=Leptidea sinapis TaxID=189913 RepID=A0A5E4QN45_9NEOP|nr:unnamed protein product [Leptidea sinapis]
MSIVWCNERVLKLIELYQNYECLWDTAHRDYKNKLKKIDAWDSIAKTLNVSAKEIESNPLARGRNLNLKNEVAVKIFLAVEDHSSTQHQNEEARADQTDTVTETIPQTGKKVAKKRSHDEKIDEVCKKKDEECKKKLEEKDEMTDEFDVYGKYVASELRNIKDEYSTLIAKQFINNILTDARIGKYRQEYSTGRQNTPGTSTSNDGTTNQDSVEINDEDVNFELRNIISDLQD